MRGVRRSTARKKRKAAKRGLLQLLSDFSTLTLKVAALIRRFASHVVVAGE